MVILLEFVMSIITTFPIIDNIFVGNLNARRLQFEVPSFQKGQTHVWMTRWLFFVCRTGLLLGDLSSRRIEQQSTFCGRIF